MALTFSDDQEAELLKLLGLPEAAPGDTDAGLVLDTAADFAAQVAEIDPAKPSTVAAAAKRAGLEVLDTDTLATLRHDAQEGRQIRAAAERQKIEAVVGDAISKGKITPARRKHWIDLINADRGMADVLAAVPNETAVPVSEMGHSNGADGSDGGPTAEWFY